MSLVKRIYVDGETVIIAQNLNDIQDAIIENETDIEGKVDTNQGTANEGKAMVVGSDGNLSPEDITIEVDPTLTQEGEAADAKATGDAIRSIEDITGDGQLVGFTATDLTGAANELKGDTSELKNTLYPVSYTYYYKSQSKNLLNIDTVSVNKVLDVSNGAIINYSGWFVSAPIPVSADETVYFTRAYDATKRTTLTYTVCAYNTIGNYIAESSATNVSVYTAPTATSFIRVSGMSTFVAAGYQPMVSKSVPTTSASDYEKFEMLEDTIAAFFDYFNFNYEMASGSKNLLDLSKLITNCALNTSTGEIDEYDNWFVTNLIPISGNRTVYFTRAYDATKRTTLTYIVCAYDENGNFITDSGVANVTSYTTPVNTKFIRASGMSTFATAGYEPMISEFVPTFSASDFEDYKEFREGTTEQFVSINNSLVKWKGKKGVVFGDSLTAQGYYTSALNTLFGMTIENCGVSGSLYSEEIGSIQPIYTEVSNAQTDSPDFIFIMGGTNDYSAQTDIGDVTDTTIGTVCGGCYLAFNAIRTKWPLAPVFVGLTPLRNTSMSGVPSGIDGFDTDHALNKYNEAIRQMALRFGFNVVDGRECGISISNLSTYTQDGLHFNATGGVRFAQFLVDKMNVITPY